MIDQSIIDRTLRSSHGEAAYKVCETLLDAGYEAWWVGGCVRDMFLGEDSQEIDIATDAKPEMIKKLFPKHDAKGEQFGSIIVTQGAHQFEVTTFREDDSASDGRHPESVTFGKRENDAARRDITVNALYWNPISSETFDPYEGEKDLHEKLIRIIGDPTERITHDALRLLRVIRFRARIAGQYHPDTFAALHSCAEKIEVLSGSRRFEELEKILLGPHPDIAFEDLWETDIIEHLLPELHACKGVGQPNPPHGEGDVWNHMLRVIASFHDDHDRDVRWAALLHDIGKPETFSIEADRIHFNEHASVGEEIARDILDRLQCTSRRRDKIVWLVAHHMMMGTFFAMPEDRKAHWYFHPWFTALLDLFWLDAAGTDPSDFSLFNRIVHDREIFLDAHPAPPKQLLSGDEVMELLGIPPGERVGEILKQLHDKQIAKEINSKEEAREFLKKLV